jgi:hypothetical protein
MIKQTAVPFQSEGYDLDFEKQNLNKFLKDNKLFLDTEFINKIAIGDIIEIYSVPNNVQIFQNNEFKKICSYTPEQMSTIPFPKLFWRSEEDHTSLMQRASQVMATETGCVDWNIKSHELVESLHPRKRTFEIKMGNIVPCFDIETRARKGWASTLTVTFIFEWKENLR